jgi:hypothetical protein
MPDIQIERLVLKAGAMDAQSAKRLAAQVAAGLERAPLASDLPQRLELIRFEVAAAPGATADRLTQQILAELMRELRRS